MIGRVLYKSMRPYTSVGFSTRVYKNYINGEWVESKGTQWFDIRDPVTQNVVARSPQSTEAELEAAIQSSAEAFKTWSTTPILTRQKYMFDLAHIIRRDMDKYAARMTEEHGKTKPDARGDVIRGLEVVEHACGTSHIITG